MTNKIDSAPGREINIDHKSFLYFGGTSYLGLQTNSEFQNILINNIKKYGSNYSASRKSNIQLSIFDEVELYLANTVGSPNCITLSSGYLAGQLVAQTLNAEEYELFYAPNTHSAMHTSSKKHYSSFSALNSAIRSHLNKCKSIPVLLFDTIDTDGQNYPDFKGLQQLPLDQIILVADDSHGIGIVGECGGGAYQKLTQFNPKELIVCCSLGKGFGVQGGAIFGEKSRIKSFSNTIFFGGASPAIPAALAAILAADEIFKKKRALLQQHIQLFLALVKNISQFKYISNYPSFGFSNVALAKHLKKNNIIITNFNYPTKNDPLVSRIVLSAHHHTSDIEKLAKAINQF